MMNGILITMVVSECKKLLFFKKPRECELIYKRSYCKRKKKSFFMNENGRTWKLSFLFTRRLLRSKNEFKQEMEKLFLPRLWQALWFSASETLTPLCTLYFFMVTMLLEILSCHQSLHYYFSFNIFLIKWKNLSSRTGEA